MAPRFSREDRITGGRHRWSSAGTRYSVLGPWWPPIAKERPLLPQESCPLCPGSGKVPEDCEVLAYDNDFPSLVPDPPEPGLPDDDLAPVKPSMGKCEVALYSPDHHADLYELPLEHLVKLVEQWRERYIYLGSLPNIDCVFIFENRGETVGVTIHHPHGQIYAHPFVPLRLQVELASCEEHWREQGSCLLCDLSRCALTASSYRQRRQECEEAMRSFSAMAGERAVLAQVTDQGSN